MRILHLVHQFMPEKIGGTELYTRTLAQRQAKQGHSVAIFTPSAQIPSSTATELKPETEAGVRTYRFPVGIRTAATVFRNTFSHQEIHHAFAKLLQQERPDIIHIQHLMGIPVRVIEDILAADIPFIVTLHDYWYLCANAQLLTNYDNVICPGPKLWINCARCALARAGHPNAIPLIPAIAPIFGYRNSRLQQVLAKAQTIIAPTRFVRNIYGQAGHPIEKIRVVTHGIRLPEQMPERKTFPEQMHVAYIGGLSGQKGIHTLIAAFNQLPEKGVKLSIIGDTTDFPDYMTQLRDMAQHPGIEFTGRLPHTQLWQVLATIDVVVVPSLWYETSSLIIQEAFAAQVPVIASNIGALQEKVSHESDGILVPSGDEQALYDALKRFLLNPNLRKQLQAGIQPVHTIQEHMNELDTIYNEVIGSSMADHRPA